MSLARSKGCSRNFGRFQGKLLLCLLEWYVDMYVTLLIINAILFYILGLSKFVSHLGVAAFVYGGSVRKQTLIR